MSKQILRERFDVATAFSEAAMDNAERSIKNVVLIRAGRSANDRYYPDQVLLSAAALFNNAASYANHDRGDDLISGRSMRDLTGWYQNVRYEGQALKADRYFTRTQAGEDAWQLAQQIVSGEAPKTLAGLSINAMGEGHIDEEGTLMVDSITRVFSVDDVDVPAAGGAYLERTGSILDHALGEMDYLELYERLPERFIERFKNENKTVRKDAELTALQEDNQALRSQVAQLTQARDTLQQQLDVQQADHEAALVAAAEATEAVRRELQIERVLSTSKLPTEWLKSLREELQTTPPDKWAEKIDTEYRKAGASGATQRVPVSGVGQQTHTLPQPIPTQREAAPADGLARDGETFEQWKARTAGQG